MASITLKNVPDELLERLRARAERNRRSLMKEALYLLELGVGGQRSGLGLRAGESTADYGVESPGMSPERERERQLEVWRELCGQWESEESVSEEIEAIYSTRTAGREVEL